MFTFAHGFGCNSTNLKKFHLLTAYADILLFTYNSQTDTFGDMVTNTSHLVLGWPQHRQNLIKIMLADFEKKNQFCILSYNSYPQIFSYQKMLKRILQIWSKWAHIPRLIKINPFELYILYTAYTTDHIGHHFGTIMVAQILDYIVANNTLIAHL